MNNIYDVLIFLKDRIANNDPECKKCSICPNIYNISMNNNVPFEGLGAGIRAWMSKYGKSSGTLFPIGDASEYVKEQKSGTFWDNPKRHELLDFLIDYYRP